MSARLNVSGYWNGAYSYRHSLRIVMFSAQLFEVNGDIAGSTEEAAPAADLSFGKLSATLRGVRSHLQVSWLKRYDEPRPDNYAQPIIYEGELTSDGLEIRGEWKFPGLISGTFLMIRALGTTSAAEREASTTAR